MEEKILEALGKINQRFDNLEKRFDNLERRLDKVEQRFDKLEQRFENLETEVKGIKEKQLEHDVKFNKLLEETKGIDEQLQSVAVNVYDTKNSVDEIKKEMGIIEAVTKDNVYEIAKLKAIK